MTNKEISSFHIDFIKHVGLGINISRTYPKGHPSLAPVIERLKLTLKETPLEKESISLILVEDVLMVDDERIDSKRLPIVKSLVDRLVHLGIKSITFNVYAADSDIKEFFLAMAATTADIEDYNGIEALVKARGITGIEINKFRVGVVSSDEEAGKGIDWGGFLESLSGDQTKMTEEEKSKELTNFLMGLGIKGNEAAEVQSGKIIGGLEKLALMIAGQYGEDRWSEYSLVFARLLAVLSPNIKKNIMKYRIENKKIAVLFKELIPTMSDQDIVDIISTRTKDKIPATEEEVVDILRTVTGTRLPGVLSTLRINVPELNFEKIAAQLMHELKTTHVVKMGDKFSTKNLEVEMRQFFPSLRDPSPEERRKAVDGLMEFSNTFFERKNYDLVRLVANRFDTMTDVETDIKVFTRVIECLKILYLKAKELRMNDLVQFVSKKFGKHLMRKEPAFLERKNIIIRTINEVGDTNYVVEMISLLWDPGTFGEAREVLVALADYSALMLIESLKDTEDRAVRMKIIDVLVRIGPKAMVEVKKLMNVPEWYVRRNGIFILGEMKAVDAVDEIGRFIDDHDERVQLEVVASLSKIGGVKATEYIIKALNSKFHNVFLEAMKFLPKDDVKHKLAEVTRLIKTRKGVTDEKVDNFKCELIRLLGRVGDDSVIDTLVEVINERGFFRGDTLLRAKEYALNALVQIGSRNALNVLNDLTTSNDHFVSTKTKEILRRRESKQG